MPETATDCSPLTPQAADRDARERDPTTPGTTPPPDPVIPKEDKEYKQDPSNADQAAAPGVEKEPSVVATGQPSSTTIKDGRSA